MRNTKQLFKWLLSLVLLITMLGLGSCGSKHRKYKYSAKKNKALKMASAKLAKSKWKNVSFTSNGSAKPNHFEAKEVTADEEEVATNGDYDTENEYHLPYDEKQYAGYFKIGNPYEVSGISYEPQDYESYEEVGTASWYGDDFHGKKTANGETYDMRDMTAAHPTLPLPSLVRITNLRNGKKVVARVNDRGPFAKDRIIDVSQRVAEALDFKQYGTTEVRIELLKDDTEDMLNRLKIK